jgi:uncharacterized membrane protein
MKIKKRQMAGVALMTASALTAIFIQAFTGRVLELHSIHTDFIPPNAIATDSVIVFHWEYTIPLAAAFVIGLVCCAWPTRKPPRIIS